MERQKRGEERSGRRELLLVSESSDTVAIDVKLATTLTSNANSATMGQCEGL